LHSRGDLVCEHSDLALYPIRNAKPMEAVERITYTAEAKKIKQTYRVNKDITSDDL